MASIVGAQPAFAISYKWRLYRFRWQPRWLLAVIRRRTSWLKNWRQYVKLAPAGWLTAERLAKKLREKPGSSLRRSWLRPEGVFGVKLITDCVPKTAAQQRRRRRRRSTSRREKHLLSAHQGGCVIFLFWLYPISYRL